MKKKIHIFGGGTVAHVASHLAISAPAYGNTARSLSLIARARFENMDVHTHMTRMAGGLEMETNADVEERVKTVVSDPTSKVIFFNCALVDFSPASVSACHVENGHIVQDIPNSRSFAKNQFRFSSDSLLNIELEPAPKIISGIRAARKDITLVGFKTTCGASKQTMFEKGLRLCKESHVNLVLVNDVMTRWNMIVTPEEAAYHETQNRDEALHQLVDMAYYRSQLTFTQSTVVTGDPIPWNSDRVPANLREVVNYCVAKNAYKPFSNATVGHFACKLNDTTFLTSIRRSNFNDLATTGLVEVRTDGPDAVIAYGAKPSVGGQSQRTVFRDHPGYDCIVHFHCPLRPAGDLQYLRDAVPVRSQREIECGSHQCGQNTSDGLAKFFLLDGGGMTHAIKAVMLENHGPNIVFNKHTPASLVIDFIERNFDLSKKTGGYHL